MKLAAPFRTLPLLAAAAWLGACATAAPPASTSPALLPPAWQAPLPHGG